MAIEYKPEYAVKLEEHLKTGSFPSFAGVIYVSENTLWKWVKLYPDFAAAKATKKKRKTTSVYTGVLGANREIKYYKKVKNGTTDKTTTVELPADREICLPTGH